MELVVRATVMFVLIWALTRGLRRRALSEMSAFDMILLVVLGDIVQQSITQEDYSITGAALVAGTFAFWVSCLSWVSCRWPRAQRIIEGAPLVIVMDGKVVEEAMRLEQIPMADLLEAARQQGVCRLEEIELAVLEPGGKYSIIRRGT